MRVRLPPRALKIFMTPETYIPPEIRKNAIIEQNIQKMRTEMNHLLSRESWGGNAGNIDIDGKSHVCAAANCFCDIQSGEIKKFGNWQSVDSEIRDNYPEFSFRVADINNSAGQETELVVNLIYRYGMKSMFVPAKEYPEEPEGMKVLRETVETYNIRKAKSLEDLYMILKVLGGLQGTKIFYTSDELTGQIERVKRGELSSDYITRRAGLRDRVEKLLTGRKR